MKFNNFRLLILFLALSIIVSCKVAFIGAYDVSTDQGIQKVQADVAQLLVTLKRNLVNNNASANQYTNFSKTYDSIEGEVENLQIRCKALPKYSIVVSQLNLANKNVMDVEKLHKIDDFKKIGDTTVINIALSNIEVQFSAMVALQNGLKADKTN